MQHFNMPIVWTQVLNAVTMISPLIALILNSKKSQIHEKVVGKTLIVHIPISFAYHMSSALNAPSHTTKTLKIADLSLIHIYAVTVQDTFKKRRTRFNRIQSVANVMNKICVYRICRGYEDTLFRLSSLYVGSYSLFAACTRIKKTFLTVLGLSSSLLFYFDDHLMHMGHPTFHILLGFLHNDILELCYNSKLEC